jgi:DNA-binding CsgD family transcriptional regulator
MTVLDGADPSGELLVPSLAGGTSPERRALLGRLRTLARPGLRVLLVGQPGIGKTTVLEQLVAGARADGAAVLHARAAEELTVPFQGLVDLLGPLPEELFADLPEVQRIALDVALARRPAGDPLPALALSSAVVAVVRELARRQPVLIAVDDWPWLDRETARLVRHLLDRPADLGRLPALVATARTDWLGEDNAPPCLELSPVADVVPVPPLSRDALGAVLTASLGRPLGRGQLDELYRATDGNPLWAIELAGARLRGLPGAAAGEPALPRSVADVLLERVQALPAGARAVLAVVGAAGGAPPATVAGLVEDGDEAVVEALDLGVVRDVGQRLVPEHPLLGTAALRALGLAGRMQLHRRLAAVARTEAERAHQLNRAALPGPDDEVAAAMSRAGQESRRRGATATALAQFEVALQRTAPASPARSGRVFALAEASFAAGDLERCRALLTTLDPSTVGLDVLDRAMPLLIDSVTATKGDRYMGSLVTRLRQELSGSPIRQAVVDVYGAELAGDPATERLARAERVLAVLPPGGGQVPTARHRALGAAVLAGIDLGRGLDRARLAEAAALESGLAQVGAKNSARSLVGVHAYQVADDLAGSRTALQELVQRATSAGEELMAAFFSSQLAVVELLSGDLPLATALLARLAPVEHAWGPDAPPSLLRARGLVALSSGGVAAVDALLARTPEPADSPEHRLVRSAISGIGRGREEDWGAALPLLEEARAVALSLDKVDPGRRLWVDVELGEALVALGRPEEAAELADQISEIAAGGDRPLLRAQALRLRGLVAAATGDLAEAEALLTDAVATVASTGFVLELGLTQLALGRVLRRRRAHRQAQIVLAEASALAERLGDQPFLTRTRRFLGGATTTRRSQLLTRAEERVAVSAAAGLSNAEIAAEHFLSVRTVETHLRAVYGKLGLRSRGQLAAYLADRSG